ncbi:phosphatidylserine decarboxylase 1 [Pichia californica]|uniref:Phosphatidylserine decarboxylase proenzyme 1, mitochondrial n=1 Tax=Pichia californica TaxID=460514 RepID=A0A9P6WLL5_9ASCO|nr:phosphatidylserine decarboxylase 1 [[Candida] californica]
MFFVKNIPPIYHTSSYSTFNNGNRNLSTLSEKNHVINNKPNPRKPFRAFILITLGALLFISIKDYQETALNLNINDDELVRPTSWPLFIYSYLPLNTLSRLWGGFNSITLPENLRSPGYKLYSYLFGVNLNEMKDPDLTHYKNLSEFFYREIKPECRPIDPTALLVSPSDGKILKFGKVNNDGRIEQVKGMTYKLEALLGASESQKVAHSQSLNYENYHQHHDSDDIFLSHLQNNTNLDCTSRVENSQQSLINFSQQGEKSNFHPSTNQVLKVTTALSPSLKETDLFYTVIYLAPGDYHRFHSPVTWVTTLRRHFVGELYSVAPYFQRAFNNLFVLNERVALLGYWKYGFFSMTPVGATNVGSIKINFDKDLVTNTKFLNGSKSKKNTCYEAHYTNASTLLKGQPLLKGEEMGGFMLGSTVVLVFEAPKDFKFTIHENQYIKMGQCLGETEN